MAIALNFVLGAFLRSLCFLSSALSLPFSRRYALKPPLLPSPPLPSSTATASSPACSPTPTSLVANGAANAVQLQASAAPRIGMSFTLAPPRVPPQSTQDEEPDATLIDCPPRGSARKESLGSLLYAKSKQPTRPCRARDRAPRQKERRWRTQRGGEDARARVASPCSFSTPTTECRRCPRNRPAQDAAPPPGARGGMRAEGDAGYTQGAGPEWVEGACPGRGRGARARVALHLMQASTLPPTPRHAGGGRRAGLDSPARRERWDAHGRRRRRIHAGRGPRVKRACALGGVPAVRMRAYVSPCTPTLPPTQAEEAPSRVYDKEAVVPGAVRAVWATREATAGARDAQDCHDGRPLRSWTLEGAEADAERDSGAGGTETSNAEDGCGGRMRRLTHFAQRTKILCMDKRVPVVSLGGGLTPRRGDEPVLVTEGEERGRSGAGEYAPIRVRRAALLLRWRHVRGGDPASAACTRRRPRVVGAVEMRGGDAEMGGGRVAPSPSARGRRYKRRESSLSARGAAGCQVHAGCSVRESVAGMGWRCDSGPVERRYRLLSACAASLGTMRVPRFRGAALRMGSGRVGACAVGTRSGGRLQCEEANGPTVHRSSSEARYRCEARFRGCGRGVRAREVGESRNGEDAGVRRCERCDSTRQV
ncbi:hypothetical protein FB451DRAFT_1440934 [Mycena latifolia]|nr:hypothetical protein FB451DRAFT_1440934 [Mycena latifolia]